MFCIKAYTVRPIHYDFIGIFQQLFKVYFLHVAKKVLHVENICPGYILIYNIEIYGNIINLLPFSSLKMACLRSIFQYITEKDQFYIHYWAGQWAIKLVSYCGGWSEKHPPQAPRIEHLVAS